MFQGKTASGHDIEHIDCMASYSHAKGKKSFNQNNLMLNQS